MAVIADASLRRKRARRPSMATLVGAGLLLFLSWQVLTPLLGVLVSSLKDLRPLDAGFLSAPLTLANFAEILGAGSLWSVTSTTFLFAFLSSTLALAAGCLLAFVTVRTDLRFRGVIAALVLLQLAIPELMIATSWTFLWGPELGLYNRYWQALTGAEGPLFDVYGLAGMVMVESLILIPLVYLFAVPAFAGFDGSMEDAAMMSGASRWRAVRAVSLPLVAPALAATWIIAFMRAWEAFEVPWVLGLRNRIMTYATRIYWDTVTPPSDTGVISAYAVPMIAFAATMVLLHHRVTAAGERYAVMSGKPSAPQIVRLRGLERLVVGAAAFGITAFGIFIPFLTLIWVSLQPFYKPPSFEALASASFRSYARVLEAEGVGRAVLSSLIVGGGASLLLVTASVLTAWLAINRRTKAGALAQMLCFLPVALPNIVVGLAFLWVYMLLDVGISRTYFVLILAYFTLFLAVVSQNILTCFTQIHGELLEASRVCGAGEFRVLLQICLPLLGPAILVSVLFVMVWSFKELPASLLLSSSSTRTVAVLMFDLSRSGSMSVLAAISICTVAFLLVLMAGFQIMARKAGIRGI